MLEQITVVDQVTAQFNAKFFKRWKKLSDQALASLTEGLKKIQFDEPVPESIIQLRQDIQEAQDAYADPTLDEATKNKRFIAVMTKTQRHLDRIVKNNEFSDPNINLFFMNSRRAYSNLTGVVFKVILNDYNQFISGFMNPSGRERTDQLRLPGIAMHAYSHVNTAIADNMLADVKNEVIPTYNIAVTNLPKTMHSQGKPNTNTNQNGNNCLLERKMGKANYATSNQDDLINSPEEAAAWLGRQIYRLSFDHFYTECGQLYQILQNAEAIASKEQTSEAVQAKKQELLRNMGMEELSSRDSRKYIDDLAKALGFRNIDDLGQNFKELDTPQGFDEFNLKKQFFVSHADQEDLQFEADPLVNVKTIAKTEASRVRNKLKEPNFQNYSSAYGATVMSSGSDFVNGTDASLRAKNIATSIARDYITAEFIHPLIGLDEGGDIAEKVKVVTDLGARAQSSTAARIAGQAAGIVGQVVGWGSPYLAALAEKTGAMGYANQFTAHMRNQAVEKMAYARNYADQTLKSQLEKKLLFCMGDERYIQERGLSYIAQDLNATILDIRKRELDEHIQSQIETITSLSRLHLNDEAIQNYVIRTQSLNSSQKILDQTDRDLRQEFLLQEESTRQLENEHRRYKLAFEYNTAKDLLSMDPQQLTAFINKQTQNIAQSHSRTQQITAQIERINQKNERFLRSQKTLFGRLTRFRDAFVGLFGYTTASAKKRKFRSEKFDFKTKATAHDLESARLESEIYTSLLEKAEATQNTRRLYENQSPEDLKYELIAQLDAHIQNYTAIQNLYANSSADKDITAQLISLDLNYMQSSNSVTTICNLLINKLSDPHAREAFAQDNFASIESILERVRQFRSQTHQFQNVLPIPETDERRQLQDALTGLEASIFETIQTKNKIIESKVVDEFRFDVQKLLRETDVTKIHDPFQFVFNSLLNGQDIPARILNQYSDIIAKEFISHLEKNKATLDRRKLEDFSMGLAVGFHEYSVTTDQEGYVNTLLNRYHTVITKVESLIEERYHALSSLGFEEQRKCLEELDADLIHHYEDFALARKNAEDIQQSYSSWLRNPFGMVTSQDSVGKAMSLVDAQASQFYRFSERYNTVLESYIKSAPEWLMTLDKKSIQSHAQRIENEYRLIPDITLDTDNPTLSKIRTNYQQLINMVKSAEANHYENRLGAIIASHSALADGFKELDTLSKSLSQHIITHNDFDTENFSRFIELYNTLSDNIGAIHTQMVALDHQHVLRNRNTKAASEATTQWAKDKSHLERELSQLNESLEQIRRNELPALLFFDQISKSEARTIPIMDPKQYGNALIIAINKENPTLASKIIDAASNKINIQYLSKALILSAEQGNIDLIKKVLGSRKDISFNNSDLLFALSTAIQNDHLEIATYLLFNTSLELDRDTAERLQNSVLTQRSTLNNVDKEWGQLFVDNDGVYLDNIRECYAVQEGLLSSLEEEFNSLNSRRGSLQSESDPLYQAFQRDLTRFMEKVDRTVDLRDRMLSFYINGHFDNVNRKNAHLGRWDSQLAAKVDQYRSAFENIIRIKYTSTISEIRTKIHSTIDSGHNLPDLLFDLTRLKHQFSSNEAQYYQTLSEAINFASRKGQTDALQILLPFIEDPDRKAEYAYNALCQALSSRQADSVKYLLEHQAYAGREGETYHLLAQIYQNALNGSTVLEDNFTRQTLIQALSQIPVVMNPETADIIRAIAKSTPDSATAISPMTQGAWQRWVTDSDGPTINELRNAYVLSEQAYRKATDIYISIRNPFENLLIDRELKDLTNDEIREFEHKIATAEQSVKQQCAVLKELRDNYIRYILETHPEIQNHGRLQQQLKAWDENLNKVLTESDKGFKADLDYMKNHIKHYNEERAKNPSSATLRRSILHSGGPFTNSDKTESQIKTSSTKISQPKIKPPGPGR